MAKRQQERLVTARRRIEQFSTKPMANFSKSSRRLFPLAVAVYLIGFSAFAYDGKTLSHIHRFLSEEGDGQDGHTEDEGEDLSKTDLTVIVCTILSLTVVTVGLSISNFIWNQNARKKLGSSWRSSLGS